jgi:hypothetical protein
VHSTKTTVVGSEGSKSNGTTHRQMPTNIDFRLNVLNVLNVLNINIKYKCIYCVQMSESVILITVIASALLTPFLNYLMHSRCSHINCWGAECTREVAEVPPPGQK